MQKTTTTNLIYNKMNNETECLIQRQVSIQSTSSGFKINLLDGNDKNNLKYKFKVNLSLTLTFKFINRN